jgi:hypothetical protein
MTSPAPCLILERNRITRNLARGDSAGTFGWSGGTNFWGAQATVVGNLFESDSAVGTASGIAGALGISGISPVSYPEALIQGNIFRGNVAIATRSGGVGGGMVVGGTGRLTILDNLFESNLAASDSGWAGGGGLFVDDEGAVGYGRKQILRNRFVRNSARSPGGWGEGGGILLRYTLATLEENVVTENSTSGGGATAGGVSMRFSSFRVANNTITLNSSSGWSGGLEAAGVPQGGTEQALVNNTISGNYAEYSPGGLNIWDFRFAEIRNNLIQDNVGAGSDQNGNSGGGLTVGGNSSSAIVENNIISRNSCVHGGGISIWGTGNISLSHNTIVENRVLGQGGGIVSWNNAGLLLLNNIVRSNGGGQIYLAQSLPGKSYHNDIQGGWPGESNFDVDPRFADSTYRLSDSSSCIGAGIDSVQIDSAGGWYRVPPFDFAGALRPNPRGSHPDIGALESPLAVGANEPALALTPGLVDFRNVRPGRSDTLTIAISNRAPTPRDLLSISLMAGEFSLAPAPPLPMRIPEFQTAEIGLAFAPVTPGRLVRDTLHITTNDPLQPELRISLSGRAGRYSTYSTRRRRMQNSSTPSPRSPVRVCAHSRSATVTARFMPPSPHSRERISTGSVLTLETSSSPARSPSATSQRWSSAKPIRSTW